MNWLKEILESKSDNEKIKKDIVEKVKQEYVKKADYDAVVTIKQALEGQMPLNS